MLQIKLTSIMVDETPLPPPVLVSASMRGAADVGGAVESWEVGGAAENDL